MKQEIENEDYHIHMEFGDDSDENKLLEIDIDASMNSESRIDDLLVGHRNDLYIEIRICVIQGREKEAIDYFQNGIDEPDDYEQQFLSPLQKILRRPKSAGKVSFEEEPGWIIIKYTLYQEYTINDLGQEANNYLKQLKEKEYKGKIKLNLLVRGNQHEVIKEKVKVLPNFLSLDLKLKNYEPKKLFDTLKNHAPEDSQSLMNSSLFNLFTRGCKKMKMNFEMSTIRKFIRMYREAREIDQEKYVNPDKFIPKHLIKNKIEIKVFCESIGEAVVSIKFQNQNILQRLLKIINDINENI